MIYYFANSKFYFREEPTTKIEIQYTFWEKIKDYLLNPKPNKLKNYKN